MRCGYEREISEYFPRWLYTGDLANVVAVYELSYCVIRRKMCKVGLYLMFSLDS